MKISMKTHHMPFKKYRLYILTFLLLLGSLNMQSQNNNPCSWMSIGVIKCLSPDFNIESIGELRTNPNFDNIDRLIWKVTATYELNDFFKFGCEYNFINTHVQSSTFSDHYSIPGYWYSRHRLGVYVIGRYKHRNLSVSLRERYQYTYRPEKNVDRYDTEDSNLYLKYLVKSNCKNVLRSRIKIDYSINNTPFSPYIFYELFHIQNGLEKTRYSNGTIFKINESNFLDIYYRFQNFCKSDQNSDHIIGIGYKYKF